MMDFTTWRFRASQMGALMAGVKDALTDNQKKTLEGLLTKQAQNKITDRQLQTLGDLIAKRDAKPKLLKTATTLLDEIFQEVVFGRSKEIKTKYMDKGLAKEESSLTLYTQVTGNLLIKNEKNYQNDYFTGTPDNTQGLIRDIKTCWDYSTYPMHRKEIKNKAYLCQLNVYMELCGLDEAELVYCLVDTPFSMIDDELRRLSWNIGATSLDSVPKELKVETIQNHIYTEGGLIDYCHQSMDVELDWFTDFKEIRPENRLKIFKTYRDGKLIKQMKTQVELAREYLCNISVNLLKDVA